MPIHLRVQLLVANFFFSVRASPDDVVSLCRNVAFISFYDICVYTSLGILRCIYFYFQGLLKILNNRARIKFSTKNKLFNTDR